MQDTDISRASETMTDRVMIAWRLSVLVGEAGGEQINIHDDYDGCGGYASEGFEVTCTFNFGASVVHRRVVVPLESATDARAVFAIVRGAL